MAGRNWVSPAAPASGRRLDQFDENRPDRDGSLDRRKWFAGLWAAISVAMPASGACPSSTRRRSRCRANRASAPARPSTVCRRMTPRTGCATSSRRTASSPASPWWRRSSRLRTRGFAGSRNRVSRIRARRERSPAFSSRGLDDVKMMVVPSFRDRVGGSAVIDASGAGRYGRIRQHPRVLVTDLLQRGGRIAGAVGLDRTTAEPIAFAARAVLPPPPTAASAAITSAPMERPVMASGWPTTRACASPTWNSSAPVPARPV